MFNRLFLLFISVFSCFVLAQNYSIKNYSIDNGLPSQNVYSCAQDKAGRMWFATRVGVSVYDGLTWKNYGEKENLPKTSYYRLKIDSAGLVWVSPQYLSNSVCCLRGEQWHAIPPITFWDASSKSANSFDIIYNGKSVVVCIGTSSGLYYYKDSTWKKLTTENGLSDNRIYSIISIKNRLYICTPSGVSVFDGNTVDNSLMKQIPKNKRDIIAVTLQEENWKEKLWLLGKKWIGFLENSKFNLFPAAVNLYKAEPDENILFAAGINDRIYYGNSYAKYYLNTATKKIHPLLQKNGFSSNTAMSVFVDREANVWFADTRGIDKMNNFIFRNYFESTGLQSNEVSAVIETSPGNYIFGHNNGLTILEKQTYKRIDFAETERAIFSHQRVLDFAKAPDGSIWFAASELGLGRLHKTGEITWIKPHYKEIMTSVLFDKEGNLWAATNTMLYRVVNNQLVPACRRLSRFPGLRKIFYFGNGALYITSINGLYCYQNGTIRNLFSAETRFYSHARNIFTVLKVNGNGFWIGAEDGLYSLSKDKVSKVLIENFQNNIPVYALTVDKNNNIFIGTGDGFYKYEKGGKIKSYTMTNGLAGREINRSAFFLDSFNNLWIGTDRGLSCFSAENEGMKIPVPVIDLKNIELIDGSRYPLSSNINLKNTQNSFFVNFCGISYVDETAIEYKVKLEGFDKQWFNVSQSQIANLRYTNLPYGIYRFQVMAKNRLGSWSQPVYSGLITIDKPFYYKWWFILISSILELMLLFGIYKIIMLRANNTNLSNQVNQKTAKLIESENQLRLANEELEKRVEERTNELAEANEMLKQFAEEQKELNVYKDKFFAIVAHDLKSPFHGLLGVTSILEEEYDKLSQEQVKHFLKVMKSSTQNIYNLIENLLQWSRLQTGKFPFKPDKLNLLEQISVVKNLLNPNSTGKSIELAVDVPEDINVLADKNMLHSILQNLGTNAIKFTGEGGSIRFKAVKRDSCAEVSIIDNGVGISKENLEKLFRIDLQFSTKGTNDEEGTGLGLSITKEMVEKHNGNLRAESEPGKGSSFIFTLPLA